MALEEGVETDANEPRRNEEVDNAHWAVRIAWHVPDLQFVLEEMAAKPNLYPEETIVNFLTFLDNTGIWPGPPDGESGTEDEIYDLVTQQVATILDRTVRDWVMDNIIELDDEHRAQAWIRREETTVGRISDPHPQA